MRPRAATTHLSAAAMSVLLLAGGCSSGSPSATASAGASTPAATFSFTGEEPVVTTKLGGLGDERYINPGAVIEQDGTLHMFANVFSRWPGLVQVPHFVSEDGTSWELAGEKPVLESTDIAFAEQGADVSTGFVADDGTWVLIFETVSSFDPWALGRATAPGPDGPWTIDPEPILQGGPAGSWDAGGLSWPAVIRQDGEYLMYFTGKAQARSGAGAIGLARSADGITWEKEAEPVLTASAKWEAKSVDRPRVAITDRGLAMVYSGLRLTDRGLAWSADGVTWQKVGDAPVINASDFPVTGGAWDAALIERDGSLLYYLEIGAASGSAGTDVYLATAVVE